jgi:hypothetical protein
MLVVYPEDQSKIAMKPLVGLFPVFYIEFWKECLWFVGSHVFRVAPWFGLL